MALVGFDLRWSRPPTKMVFSLIACRKFGCSGDVNRDEINGKDQCTIFMRGQTSLQKLQRIMPMLGVQKGKILMMSPRRLLDSPRDNMITNILIPLGRVEYAESNLGDCIYHMILECPRPPVSALRTHGSISTYTGLPCCSVELLIRMTSKMVPGSHYEHTVAVVSTEEESVRYCESTPDTGQRPRSGKPSNRVLNSFQFSLDFREFSSHIDVERVKPRFFFEHEKYLMTVLRRSSRRDISNRSLNPNRFSLIFKGHRAHVDAAKVEQKYSRNNAMFLGSIDTNSGVGYEGFHLGQYSKLQTMANICSSSSVGKHEKRRGRSKIREGAACFGLAAILQFEVVDETMPWAKRQQKERETGRCSSCLVMTNIIQASRGLRNHGTTIAPGKWCPGGFRSIHAIGEQYAFSPPAPQRIILYHPHTFPTRTPLLLLHPDSHLSSYQRKKLYQVISHTTVTSIRAQWHLIQTFPISGQTRYITTPTFLWVLCLTHSVFPNRPKLRVSTLVDEIQRYGYGTEKRAT
ncbi:uncharacterized protein BDR25DRAFT_356636 [Lindgomyces ingoldianus]|uniref:Uncharacterized protein n=1 Tax=Lindgomyces ingoldianus TaxID=673940 RepID=A0ACB6QTJ3_9PLEO|nr:uncharacterized protein BDR25DRAFT_356636 [Lindgomyces ingoldianus]KAF2469402.1 hypothetical protein BDR25DRAFT_356636 [Lindgomyces ingoldianus]